MAPNKFEKHIKKKLQEREIRPSTNAWEKLSKKLDDASPQPKKKVHIWYGIAASFIGLLIVSVLYFNFEGTVNTTEVQIVDTDDKATEINVNDEIVVEKDIEDAVVDNNQMKQSPANDVKKENQIPELKNQITSVEEIDTVIDPAGEKAVSPDAFKEEIINTKIWEIVAAVDSLEQNNTALTNAAVDDLLRNAQEEILRDKLFNQSGSVDAMALLIEVEDELDQSFRDQIFESLKAGFLKVRTAVADRNE